MKKTEAEKLLKKKFDLVGTKARKQTVANGITNWMLSVAKKDNVFMEQIAIPVTSLVDASSWKDLPDDTEVFFHRVVGSYITEAPVPTKSLQEKVQEKIAQSIKDGHIKFGWIEQIDELSQKVLVNVVMANKSKKQAIATSTADSVVVEFL